MPDAAEFRYVAEVLRVDGFGEWLLLPQGAQWSAPGDQDRGQLAFSAVVLLPPNEHWVAWWVSDPQQPRLQIDVARPVVRDEIGWWFVDLELDVFAPCGSAVPVLRDQEELAERVHDGSISRGEATIAQRTAGDLMASISEARLPWCNEGWTLLAQT